MPAVNVLDSTISYMEVGAGVPLVFLHGNPTSSYLWRRVLPQIGDPGRCLAPDLIGMGNSGKPPVAYRFADHARYLDAWFDALDLDGVVLIGHDWGGALAFDWATRHSGRTRGVAFMETIVRPISWDEFPEGARPLFKSFRTPGIGETMILDENVFIEQALPRTVAADLTDEDMEAYRKPYLTHDSRLPLLQWPREMPLDGEPADVVGRIEAYDEWLAHSPEVPKLLLTFDPGLGAMMGPQDVAWCAANIAGLEIEHCGYAGHHAPEDQPDAIAAAIVAWADRHDLRSDRSVPRTSSEAESGALDAQDWS
ncbi:MAG TPA: haloalkane dehalogenase [Rubrobacter sp.]|nr:haloalkane dehalogenase [Rubrobacter sp.]